MLTVLLFHIFITAICSLTGLLFYLAVLKEKDPAGKPMIFYPITGLIVITLVSQLAVLFVPINMFFAVCFIAALFLLAFIKRNEVISFYTSRLAYVKEQPVMLFLLTGVLWLMTLVLNAGPTMMDDTESYHIQMIKWANEYGTVPGIANLHERFGFNSSWFTSVSFFIPGLQSLNFYTLLNGVISVWFCCFLAGQLSPLLDRKKENPVTALHISIVLVLFLSFFCWPMIRGNSTTANYDFITTMLVVVLFIKLLQSGKNITSNPFAAEWILWPAYLFTIRITNYPLLLLSILGVYALLKNREWRRVIILSATAVFLATAFIARNVILTGYPFYPSMAFNIFAADWKADNDMMKRLLDYIKYFNRVNEMFMSINDTGKLSFPDWVLAWFRYLFSYDKPIVIAGLSGIFLNFIFLKRFFNRQCFLLRFFVVVLCLQLISWFLIAPDPRFVYGCLLCGTMLLPFLLLKDKQLHINSNTFSLFFIFLIGAVLAYTSLRITRNKNYQNFLLPYRLPQPPVREIVVDNITVRIPEKILSNWNARCYATDLPCLYILNPRLRARGSSIRDGFRLEK